MKFRTLIFSFLILTVYFAQGQTNAIKNAQAISQEKVTFYETEGYSVFLQEFDYNLDDKGINKIKKKFSIPKETVVSEDADFPNIKILTSTEVKGSIKTQTAHYLSQSAEGKVKVVGFSTLCDRVKDIEKEFYNAIIRNELPREIFTPMMVDTVKFAGRSIALGPACRWMGVRNLQCPNMGQMNWSEFTSAERAKQMTDGQKALNSEMKMGDVLEDKEIEIDFEGVPVKALKRTLKIKIPQLIMGGSNILIIYYVTAEVRERFLSCVLSHYTDDIGAKKLPPLLREVMQLKE